MKLGITIVFGNPKAKNELYLYDVDYNNRMKFALKENNHIDHARTPNNITFIKKSLEEVYTKLFQGAVEEFNKDLLKKTNGKITSRNKDRLYKNAIAYLKKIQNGKKPSPYHEIIVMFGNTMTTGLESENWIVAQEMLLSYFFEFRKRNPNLEVFNAVIHLDESIPNLHIDFVPWAKNLGVNGLPIKNSFPQALMQQGFAKRENAKWQTEAWINSEKEIMIDILYQYGFEFDGVIGKSYKLY